MPDGCTVGDGGGKEYRQSRGTYSPVAVFEKFDEVPDYTCIASFAGDGADCCCACSAHLARPVEQSCQSEDAGVASAREGNGVCR